MTVAELRRILAALPDELKVQFVTDDWWVIDLSSDYRVYPDSVVFNDYVYMVPADPGSEPDSVV